MRYQYFRIIQQKQINNTWKIIGEYETNSAFKFRNKIDRDLFLHDLIEFKLTGIPTKTIKIREEAFDWKENIIGLDENLR